MAIVLDGTSGVVTPNINTANTFGFKNLLIDAGFTINQRAYVSAATLASGSYGHDRWKAGASGGNYSFTQLASSTTITIASGKSLIQVVEDKNVNGTSFVLSWTGTAQARYAVNSATPSGSYAASPILITGQTVGTTMSVEFNEGTLSKPQLELGSTATSFDVRDYGTELMMCQRYFEKISVAGITGTGAGTDIAIGGVYKVEKRAAPTLSLGSATNTDYNFFRSGAETANSGATIDNGFGSNTFSWITVIGGFTGLTNNTSWTGRKVAGIIYISAEL
jgi:hypothetical protein